MIWMDVDVALASVPVNILPLTDDTDFKTIEDAVVFNQAGLALFWNFTTTAGTTTVTAVTPTTAGDYDWTDFTTSGMYGIEIPASGGASINNDTEGFGHFTGVATGILPWRGPEIGFRSATTNDALIDAELIDNDDIGLTYSGLVSTVNSVTSFDMDTNIVHDDDWIGQTAVVKDVTNGSKWVTWISDQASSGNRLDIQTAPPNFTVAIGDEIRVFKDQHPTYALNTKDVAKVGDTTPIKTKTDQLNFGATNAVDVNVTNVAGGTDLVQGGTGDQEYGES